MVLVVHGSLNMITARDQTQYSLAASTRVSAHGVNKSEKDKYGAIGTGNGRSE